MAITYNLPPVKNDPLPAPTEYGVWERATDLRGLADSLRVASTTAAIDDIKSIPDAWAQAQLFGQALLTPDHELHGAVVAQWRGLLALLALQPMYSNDYDVEVKTLRLSDNTGGARRLRRVLHGLLPTVTLAPRADWDDASVLLFRDQSEGAFSTAPPIPIAQLSPWTLLFAGRMAAKLTHPHLPWLKDGLADPMAVEGLSSDHYSILARYTQELANALRAAGAQEHDHDRFGVYVQLLRDYHDEARRRVQGDGSPLKEARPHRNWPRGDLYQALGQTWTVDETQIPAADSLAFISVRAELADLFNGVILVDPAFAVTCGEKPENIRIWGRYTLRDALTAAGLKALTEEAEDAGYLVVRPSDFFTAKMVKFNADFTVPGNPASLRSGLAPLSPLALLVLDRSRLLESVESITRGLEHEVTLRLPLAADARRPRIRQHVISHVYSDDEVSTVDQTDDISLWPNFEATDWPWRFLHFQFNPRYQMQPRFALSARFLRGIIQAKAPRDRPREAKAWMSADVLVERTLFNSPISELRTPQGELLLHRLRFLDKDVGVGELHRLPVGAEAIFFAQRQAGGEGSEIPVGLALIEWAPVRQGPPTAIAAIDFGTTNTVAYEQRDRKSKRVTFRNRLVFPVRSTRGGTRQGAELISSYVEFMPLSDTETPLPTVVKQRMFEGERPRAIAPVDTGGHDAHGFSDMAFFVPNETYEQVTDRLLFWIQRSHLIFDIKWNKDEGRRMLIKRYLRQVMFMVSVELMAEGVLPEQISWRFSFPQAFTRRSKGHFTKSIYDAWSGIFNDLEGLRGVAPAQRIALETEGEAAFRYFTSDQEQQYVTRGTLRIMLDIGGGTTDITIACEDRICWRESFRLAGGNFFTRYLKNNIDILRKLDLPEVASFVEVEESADEHDANSWIELFISSPGFKARFDERYNAFGDTKAGKGLWDCASVALGGLLYYVGLVVGGLIRDESVPGLSPEALNTITIAFAGRGSAFFRQFNIGDPDDTELARLCGLIVLAADVGKEPESIHVETQFSRDAKHEVARGLLLERRQTADPTIVSSARRSSKQPATPIGLSVDVAADGREVTLKSDSRLDVLLAAQDIRAVSLKGLTDFLTDLRTEAGIDIDIKRKGADRLIQTTIMSNVRDTLRTLAAEDRNEADTQPLEPPFITALRMLVDIMSMPNSERDKRLVLRDVTQ